MAHSDFATSDIVDQFSAAIRAAGIEPPPNITIDGQLHRFSTSGNTGDDAGYYVVFSDGIPGGAFGDWRSGVKGTWCAKRDDSLTTEEHAELARRAKAAQGAAKADRDHEHKEAADKARELWAKLAPAPTDHTYLLRKHVQPHGLKIDRDALVVPLSIDGKLTSLQFIVSDGSKRFSKGSKTAGGAFALGTLKGAPRCVLCEGYATGASIHEATGLPVVVAFNAGNLLSVARALRKKLPDAVIVVAADDDAHTAGNPGITKATEAARATGAMLTVPDFGTERPEGLTDFNDLHCSRGLDEVRRQIEAAAPVDEALPDGGNEKSQKVPHDTSIDVAVQYLRETSHGTAADVISSAFNGRVIFERAGLDGRGEFFRRISNANYYVPFPDIRADVRDLLEAAADTALDALKPFAHSKAEITELYGQAGRAKIRARTKDFITSSIALFSDRAMVYPSVPWNETAEVVPTLDYVVDYSGSEVTKRTARPGEYFRDPAPCTADEILNAADTGYFDVFMTDLFPNEDTRRSGLECASMLFAHRASKRFQIWTNRFGDGGKNTFADLLKELVPNRIKIVKGALILYKGDAGERRFGEIELRGASGVLFDEVGGTFDVPQIKRLTSLSSIRGEHKGRDSVEFRQTWTLAAFCNELPKFFPADDYAFLARVFVLVFGSVFYSDADDRARRLAQGVDPSRLRTAADRDMLIATMMRERAGIIRKLINAWLRVRDAGGGKPYESPECAAAKEKYRHDNDKIERFFDEYFEMANHSHVPYETIKALWAEFTGDRNFPTREVIDRLLKRFSFIERGRSNGGKTLKNIRLKSENEDSTAQNAQRESTELGL